MGSAACRLRRAQQRGERTSYWFSLPWERVAPLLGGRLNAVRDESPRLSTARIETLWSRAHAALVEELRERSARSFRDALLAATAPGGGRLDGVADPAT